LFPGINFSNTVLPLLFLHRRLTIEDVVCMEVGSELIVLVSKQHQSWSSTWQPLLRSKYASKVTKPSIFESMFYYTIRMEIIRHPFHDRIMSGALTVDEFLFLCTESGGAAINIQSIGNGGQSN
jgi:hypothetical protein